MTVITMEILQEQAKRVMRELSDAAPQEVYTAQLYEVDQQKPKTNLTGRAQVAQQIAIAANATMAHDMRGKIRNGKYRDRAFILYDQRHQANMAETKIAFTRYTEPKDILYALREPVIQEFETGEREIFQNSRRASRESRRAVNMVLMSLMSDKSLATLHTALAHIFQQITWDYTAQMDISKTIQAMREWFLAIFDMAIQNTVTDVNAPWEWRKPIIIEHMIELLDVQTLDHMLQYHLELHRHGIDPSKYLN